MFRLIKLAFYGLIGYALYQLYQGMSQGSQFGDASQSRERQRAMSGDQGRMGTLTGPGRGVREKTLDSDGGSVSHAVGRGVTST